MEAKEVAEKAREMVAEESRLVEEDRQELKVEREVARKVESFRTRVALYISILAGLLAIANLGAEEANAVTINGNILTADAYTFYQAKNARQTMNQLVAEQLDTVLLVEGPNLTPGARAEIQTRVNRMKATVLRYEDEPDPKHLDDPKAGDGKKQLLARATYWEKVRNHGSDQYPNFAYAGVMVQIAIVLASVAIIVNNKMLLIGSGVAGTLGTLLVINGHFLFTTILSPAH